MKKAFKVVNEDAIVSVQTDPQTIEVMYGLSVIGFIVVFSYFSVFM